MLITTRTRLLQLSAALFVQSLLTASVDGQLTANSEETRRIPLLSGLDRRTRNFGDQILQIRKQQPTSNRSSVAATSATSPEMRNLMASSDTLWFQRQFSAVNASISTIKQEVVDLVKRNRSHDEEQLERKITHFFDGIDQRLRKLENASWIILENLDKLGSRDVEHEIKMLKSAENNSIELNQTLRLWSEVVTDRILTEIRRHVTQAAPTPTAGDEVYLSTAATHTADPERLDRLTDLITSAIGNVSDVRNEVKELNRAVIASDVRSTSVIANLTRELAELKTVYQQQTGANALRFLQLQQLLQQLQQQQNYARQNASTDAQHVSQTCAASAGKAAEIQAQLTNMSNVVEHLVADNAQLSRHVGHLTIKTNKAEDETRSTMNVLAELARNITVGVDDRIDRCVVEVKRNRQTLESLRDEDTRQIGVSLKRLNDDVTRLTGHLNESVEAVRHQLEQVDDKVDEIGTIRQEIVRLGHRTAEVGEQTANADAEVKIRLEALNQTVDGVRLELTDAKVRLKLIVESHLPGFESSFERIGRDMNKLRLFNESLHQIHEDLSQWRNTTGNSFDALETRLGQILYESDEDFSNVVDELRSVERVSSAVSDRIEQVMTDIRHQNLSLENVTKFGQAILIHLNNLTDNGRSVTDGIGQLASEMEFHRQKLDELKADAGRLTRLVTDSDTRLETRVTEAVAESSRQYESVKNDTKFIREQSIRQLQLAADDFDALKAVNTTVEYTMRQGSEIIDRLRHQFKLSNETAEVIESLQREVSQLKLYNRTLESIRDEIQLLGNRYYTGVGDLGRDLIRSTNFSFEILSSDLGATKQRLTDFVYKAGLANSFVVYTNNVRTIERKIKCSHGESEKMLNYTDEAPSCSSRSTPRDCADIKTSGETASGVYTIYVGTMRRPLPVHCDMTTDGGGWTVIQRRQDGSVDFYRGWNDYVEGFGNVSSEHWLGNSKLHALTSRKQYVLRIDMADANGTSRYAEYGEFRVASACDKYKLLSVGKYCGSAGDSLTYHVGQKFSTLDEDNDSFGANSCALQYKGAWWYGNCQHSNLNGVYLPVGPRATKGDGISWYKWTGDFYSLSFTEMKIRPVHD